jgi:hypothetical protein
MHLGCLFHYRSKEFLNSSMASSYHTQSTADAVADSSIKIEPRDHTQRSQRIETPTTVGNVQPRHFCIAFTNNPRMLRKASQELSFVEATNIPVSTKNYLK